MGSPEVFKGNVVKNLIRASPLAAALMFAGCEASYTEFINCSIDPQTKNEKIEFERYTYINNIEFTSTLREPPRVDIKSDKANRVKSLGENHVVFDGLYD